MFLSSVDCGVGKSSTSMAFARALMDSPQHQHVGMLICVGRIAQAEAMAADLVDRHDRIAVLTHETAASWTSEALNGAQLLITTQQRIARVTDGRPFGDIEAFRYLGAPRQVRVWDEAFLPGVAIALNDDSLGPLLGPARRLNPAFRHGLWSLMGTLEKSQTGDLIDIPDWPQLYGVTPYELLAAVAAEWRPQARWRAAQIQADQQPVNENEEPIRDDQRMAVTSLFFLAGRTARVWRDNATGGAMLHYRDTLPDDLKPLLVLDASGRVRQTYADQERHRGLRRLRPAQKDYTPLTVHWWKRGGGKSSFKQGGAELAKGVAATIAARPTERWLAVIHRRDRRVGDVKAMILRELPREARPKVSFLTWGQHMATNEYADVPNLVLVGSLFMPQSHIVALTHLNQDRPVELGFANREDIQRTEHGEIANLVFQAICRGRVRKSDGSRCLPMRAYVIAAERSGLGDLLPSIFPGCTVKPWEPLRKPPRGRVADALVFVDRALAQGETWIPYSAIRAALRIRDKGNFRKRITSSTAWKEAIASRSLSVTTGPRRERGLSCAVVSRAAA